MTAQNAHHDHRHTWTTTSRHGTSEGTVSYQHCNCGAQRILAPQSTVREPVAVVELR